MDSLDNMVEGMNAEVGKSKARYNGDDSALANDDSVRPHPEACASRDADFVVGHWGRFQLRTLRVAHVAFMQRDPQVFTKFNYSQYTSEIFYDIYADTSATRDRMKIKVVGRIAGPRMPCRKLFIHSDFFFRGEGPTRTNVSACFVMTHSFVISLVWRDARS